MHSRLFRRETGRRLRAIIPEVIAAYLERRFRWLNAYSQPNAEGLREYMEVLAEAVTRDTPQLYFDYTLAQLQLLLRSGTAPIALLAAGDLLQDTVLDFLTPDQREALQDMFAEDRYRRGSILREWIAPADERGA